MRNSLCRLCVCVYFHLSECVLVCVCASLSIIQIKQHFGLRRQLGRCSWQRAVALRSESLLSHSILNCSDLTPDQPPPFPLSHSAIGNAHLDRQTTRTHTVGLVSHGTCMTGPLVYALGLTMRRL